MAGSQAPLLRKSYSDEELMHLFALGRFFLIQGEVKRAQVVFDGLHEINPQFLPAILGLSACASSEGNVDRLRLMAEQGHKIAAADPVATLFYISSLLTSGDANTAGALLGEISEQVEAGEIAQIEVVRFFKSQLLRYQERVS